MHKFIMVISKIGLNYHNDHVVIALMHAGHLPFRAR